MATLEGICIVEGLPKDGVTVKLFPAGSFVSPPEGGTNAGAPGTLFPLVGLIATTLTSPTHGKIGGYRFQGIGPGVYYVGMDYLGLMSWDTHDVGATQQVDVKAFGAVGDGVTNDTAAIQAAFDDTSVGAVYFPPGTYLSGNLTITGRTHLIVEGQGATLKWTGTAGAGNQIGIQLVGSLSNIEIRNLNFDGDAVAANGHAAVWWKDGASVSHLRVIGCRTFNCVRGVSGIRSASGTWNDIQVSENQFINPIGTGASQGEAVYLQNNEATPSSISITQNYIENGQRYDIHLIQTIGAVIAGNHSRGHRSVTFTGAVISAIRVVNAKDVICTDNMVEDFRDGAIEVIPNAGDVARGIAVVDNKFINPLNAITPVTVGLSNPATVGFPEAIEVSRNTFYATGQNLDLMTLNAGKQIKVENNLCYLLAVSAATFGFVRIAGSQEGAGTADYTDEVHVSGNLFYGSVAGGAIVGVILAAAWCTSGARTQFRGNRTVGGNDFLTSAAITNAALVWSVQKIDGLTTSGTTMHPVQFSSQHLNREPIKAIVFADSPYAVLATDRVILADATGGAITLNLPAVAGQAGRPLEVIRTSAANSVVLDGNAAETIDGAATKSLDSQYAAIQIVATGAAWFSRARAGTIT